MIDFRILALGAMALLMAVYGASTASGRSLVRHPAVAEHQETRDVAAHNTTVHVDGFDLQRRQ